MRGISVGIWNRSKCAFVVFLGKAAWGLLDSPLSDVLLLNGQLVGEVGARLAHKRHVADIRGVAARLGGHGAAGNGGEGRLGQRGRVDRVLEVGGSDVVGVGGDGDGGSGSSGRPADAWDLNSALR